MLYDVVANVGNSSEAHPSSEQPRDKMVQCSWLHCVQNGSTGWFLLWTSLNHTLVSTLRKLGIHGNEIHGFIMIYMIYIDLSRPLYKYDVTRLARTQNSVLCCLPLMTWSWNPQPASGGAKIRGHNRSKWEKWSHPAFDFRFLRWNKPALACTTTHSQRTLEICGDKGSRTYNML